MINNEFAAVLRKKRTAQRLTQQALAEAAGLSLRYIQELEAAGKQPTLSTILFLSSALHTTPQQLIEPVWKKWKKEQA